MDRRFLEMQVAENKCRKDWTVAEMFSVGIALERYLVDGQGEFPNAASGKTRDTVGAALGVSGRQWDKIKAVYGSLYDDIKEKLERHGKVDRAFKQVRARERRERILAAAVPLRRVRNGDCREILPTLVTDSTDAFVFDPPFGIGFQYEGQADVADNPEDYGRWLQPIMEQVWRVLRPGGLLFVRQATKYHTYFEQWFGPHKLFASLRSNLAPAANSPLTEALDLCLVAWKPGGQRMVGEGVSRNYFERTLVADDVAGLHPCPMCLPEAEYVVRAYTSPGAKIIDPFAGVGTIPLAVQNVGGNRSCLGIELNPDYCQVAEQRLSGQIGASA